MALPGFTVPFLLTEQTTSQSLQPVHFEWSTISIFFIVRALPAEVLT
jgi:hypothetical protein